MSFNWWLCTLLSDAHSSEILTFSVGTGFSNIGYGATAHARG